jgi:hypothetical protein
VEKAMERYTVMVCSGCDRVLQEGLPCFACDGDPEIHEVECVTLADVKRVVRKARASLDAAEERNEALELDLRDTEDRLIAAQQALRGIRGQLDRRRPLRTRPRLARRKVDEALSQITHGDER